MATVSHRYPRYDLDSSLEVAHVLHEKGGRASSDELAAYLGYKSKENGAFLSRVAAARMFGLIDGGGGTFTVTQRAREILFPDFDSTRQRRLIEAFEAVPLFDAFFRRFGGTPLPPDEGMRNALVTQFGIKEDQAALALARLLDSAETAELFFPKGSRSKLVRPTITAPTGGAQNGQGEKPKPEGEGFQTPEPEKPDTSNFPKLIAGALEQLPDGHEWNEAEMNQWLQLIEMALRVVYRLPKED